MRIAVSRSSGPPRRIVTPGRLDPLGAALAHSVRVHLREAEPVPRVERLGRQRLDDREVRAAAIAGAARAYSPRIASASPVASRKTHGPQIGWSSMTSL